MVRLLAQTLSEQVYEYRGDCIFFKRSMLERIKFTVLTEKLYTIW